MGIIGLGIRLQTLERQEGKTLTHLSELKVNLTRAQHIDPM